MNRFYKFLLVIVFTPAFLSSCHDNYDICDKPRAVLCKAGFYQVVSGSAVINPASSLSFSFLDGEVLYDKKNTVSTFTFPVDNNKDSIKYSIKVSDTLPADTLTIVYTNKSETVSAECGNVFTHTILGYSVTANTIDSIKLENAKVNTTSTENFAIYY